jgi:hypothetical protein
MIGRVGRTPCQQLRGQLVSQRRILEGLEARQPRNETEIAKVKPQFKTARISSWQMGAEMFHERPGRTLERAELALGCLTRYTSIRRPTTRTITSE